MTSRTYLATVLALCAAVLVPAAALNQALNVNSLHADKNRLASEWQQATHGVTYAPPISQNRPFKALRLNDRIAGINTVVFGSSTMMGIGEGAFPPPLKSYNFAQSGNSLRAVVGEAEYVVDRWGDRLKLLVVPLDWALGFIYEAGEPFVMDLSPEAVLRGVAAARPSLAAQLADTLSLPRLKILAGILRDVLRASDPRAAFREVFFDVAGPAYRCADGTPARDFDVVYRGQCNGFRYDGSATFADQKRLDAGRERAVVAAAASGGSQYAAALRRSAGEPNRALLDRLAALARHAEARGVGIVFLMPPLAPGVEEALSRSAHGGAALRATHEAIAAWSAAERVTVLDAGRSERYGCLATEFIDAHHALPECHARILARFFRDHPGTGQAPATPSR